MSPSRFLGHSFENSIFSLLQVSIIGIRFSHQNMLLYTQESKEAKQIKAIPSEWEKVRNKYLSMLKPLMIPTMNYAKRELSINNFWSS